MARLRNRIVKADFWSDPELLRWPREKRTTYQGLWAMAEDSGCLEDDPFGWKLLLWPSPLDADITVERLEEWRNEFVEAGKLVPYQADGKAYLYAKNFHQHERPRNPQSPNLPLPPWVFFEPKEVKKKDGSTTTINRYREDREALDTLYGDGTVTVPSRYGDATDSPVQSSPVLIPKMRARARENLHPLVLLAQEEIPGWKPDDGKDQALILRHLKRLGESQVESIILQLAGYQAEKGKYKDLRLTLNKWLTKEKKPEDNDPGGPPLIVMPQEDIEAWERQQEACGGR